ncbi:MAG: nucleotidyltransferase domain-containing protein [Flavobacteriales bacterium]|nr:nucleotidyltransferase domain-containing protein [Flavobacteriales bacterium]
MLKLIEQNRESLLILCKKYDVVELYLFGSATGQSFDSTKSDLDFAVKFSAHVPVVDMADHFFGLISALENLFNKKVDLVSIPALKNPIFIEELNSTKVQLYAA